MNEDLEFFNLKPTPTQIRGYMEEERRKAFAKGYAEGKAYWEPSEAHKDAWREEALRDVLETVEAIEFFEWDEWTQKRIKARIRSELTK
jgi:hypothetical protein